VNTENVRDKSQIASGRLFQVRGPATANDLSPNDVCMRSTWSFPLSADLIPGRQSTLGRQNSARYSGARPLMHLSTRVASLYVTRCRIGNQCRDLRFGVIMLRSRFSTGCSHWSWQPAMPYNKALQSSKWQLMKAWTSDLAASDVSDCRTNHSWCDCKSTIQGFDNPRDR